MSDEIRDVESCERSGERRGRQPLTRHVIHEMALWQEHAEDSWQAQLRFLGLVPKGAITDRHGDAKIKEHLGEVGRKRGPPEDTPKGGKKTRERISATHAMSVDMWLLTARMGDTL